MLLNEFIYFSNNDDEVSDLQNVDRYNPHYDTSVIKIDDTRKSRLTLRMINRLRKASEAREQEHRDEMELIKKMYGNPPAPM